MARARMRWHPLVVRGELNPALHAAMRERSGVYAIRKIGESQALYVGESHCGKLWRTMLRHFQAPQTFKTIGRGSFAVRSPEKYEIAFRVTSKGNRKCRAPHGAPSNADRRAIDLETAWIGRLKPTVNREELGEDDTSFDFGANTPESSKGEEGLSEFLERHNPRVGSADRAWQLSRAALKAATEREKSADEKHDAAARAHRALSKKLGEKLFDGVHDKAWRLHLSARDAHWEGDPEAELGAAQKAAALAPRPAARRAVVSNPKGALIELGALTELVLEDDRRRRVTLRWSLRTAPVLAYDEAGRLFVLYPGRVVRASTNAEREAYNASHWAERAKGTVRAAIRAGKPLRRLGVGKEIVYTTMKGRDRKLVDYRHKWGDGAEGAWRAPVVAIHECGASSCEGEGAIAIVGGTYRMVADRGIVG